MGGKRQSPVFGLGIDMSSGQWKRVDSFNQLQIKDGWVVRMGKDGKIRERIEKYPKEKRKRS
jgi:hypothetical protein